MADEIINRVARSGIITLDLSTFLPSEILSLDIAPWLWNGIALKEELFREHMEKHDWKQYASKSVHVHCSEDAIIPTWAYMLIATKLADNAHEFHIGSRVEAQVAFINAAIDALNLSELTGKRVVIKGCSAIEIPHAIYAKLTAQITPVAKMVMYGEPCSTVPLYRKSRD